MVLSLGTVCVFVTFVVYGAYIVTFVDIMFLTETWLRPSGDKAKCADLAPLGYSVHSLTRSPGKRLRDGVERIWAFPSA